MALTLYGIPNCTTVKRARAFLADHAVAHVFHDVKKQGLSAATLQHWADLLGWERLVNRQGTTWRQLDPACQAAVVDAPSAVAQLLATPSLMRCPVVVWPDGHVSVGFDAPTWAQALKQPV